MAKFFEALDDKLIAFIEAQPMFFIASAAREGRVNLSPKGLDTFRVFGPNLVAYLDITGSGNETAAHAQGGRASHDHVLLVHAQSAGAAALRPHANGRARQRALARICRPVRASARRAADRRDGHRVPATPPAASACR